MIFIYMKNKNLSNIFKCYKNIVFSSYKCIMKVREHVYMYVCLLYEKNYYYYSTTVRKSTTPQIALILISSTYLRIYVVYKKQYVFLIMNKINFNFIEII